MNTVKVKIHNTGSQPLPAYATPGASGMDVRADIERPMVVDPGQRVLVPTGLRVEIPRGYELQLRPRSGLALRNGITLLNTPGTIDADYRGEIGVILMNLGADEFVIAPGERICQAVLAPVCHIDWEPVSRVDQTERGDGAFGHTGVQ